ncbi:transposase, partial [Helicobacter mehlei]
YFPSSQICSTCGSNTGKKPLHIRNYVCPCCQTHHHSRLTPVSILERLYFFTEEGNVLTID